MYFVNKCEWWEKSWKHPRNHSKRLKKKNFKMIRREIKLNLKKESSLKRFFLHRNLAGDFRFLFRRSPGEVHSHSANTINQTFRWAKWKFQKKMTAARLREHICRRASRMSWGTITKIVIAIVFCWKSLISSSKQTFCPFGNRWKQIDPKPKWLDKFSQKGISRSRICEVKTRWRRHDEQFLF